jgi:glycosyltransferase involved in cell wall biosynthesis
VLYVTPDIPVPGTHGGSRHVVEVAEALADRAAVLVLAREGSSHPLASGSCAGLVRHSPRGLQLLLWLRRTKPEAVRFAPTVVLERGSAWGLGALLGRSLGVPVVTEVLDPELGRFSRWWSARFLATEPRLVPAAQRARVVPVHWGANTSRFSPAVDGRRMRRVLGVGTSETLVVYAGGFYRWHDLDTLVNAVARLTLLGPRIRLALVGDGERRDAIERAVGEKALRSMVTFTGAVPHDVVPEYVAAADVCVALYDPAGLATTRRHGFYFEPLKVFECLAAGRAVVASDLAPISSLFRSGEHLVLVPPGDPARLATALATLGADGAQRAALGSRGAEEVAARYTWRAHTDHLLSIFDALPGT